MDDSMNDSNMIETPKTFWEKTYRQNINKLIGVGYRYTIDKQIAEDLAHDAFMIAYEKQSSFKGKGPFEAWLRRIVVNLCLQHLRKQHKKEYLGNWLSNTTDTEEMDEENLQKEQAGFTEKELLAAINQLPEHHKMVFNLYVIDKFTHAQIGKELGISEGTSKSHLARARKKIRALLYEKPATEKKQTRKTAFFLFWKVDRLYTAKFKHFELPVHKAVSFDSLPHPSAGVPTIDPSIPLLTKFSGVSVATMLTVVAILSFIFWPKNKQEKIVSAKVKSSKIYPGDTATIPQSGIMYTDNKIVNKKSADMKNLKGVGALLLAGTTLAMTAKAQDSVNVDNNVITAVAAKPAVSVKVQADNKTTAYATTQIEQNANVNVHASSNVHVNVDISGTFYGERLRWSPKNKELYFEGKSIIDFGKNNFVVDGSSNFLGKVYFLVIDGNPIKLEGEKVIKLTEKKYNLTELSPASATKKYGEAGKNGAIEISLAE